MNIIVQKYGGSSVADKEKLELICNKIIKEKNKNVKQLEKQTGYSKYEQRTYDNLDSLYANLK